MPQELIDSNKSLSSPTPAAAGTQDPSPRAHSLHGQPPEDTTEAKATEATGNLFDLVAAGLYSVASMLVGEGEASARLVESAVASSEFMACQNPLEARKISRQALCSAALEVIARRDPGSLAAPEGLKHASTCIEDDDLDAAAESGEQFQRMMAGPDRDRVRHWLASLPTVLRTIFVLRAVAGFTSTEIAALLAAHGGPRSAGWTHDAVREFFRQGLCSLASQLLQASTAR